MNNFILIYCTVPDNETAETIAGHLVEKCLAACCNIVPSVKSVYRWNNKVQIDDELLLIIKSTEENFKKIEHTILKHHPYEIPEIISVSINDGHRQYLKWINQNTKVSYG